MRNIFDNLLIPSLLVIGLSLNLLLPIHSSSYYLSILTGELIYEHCFRVLLEGSALANTFSEMGSGLWFSSAPLYDLLIYLLESRFGTWGVAALQISVWLLIGVLSLLCLQLISLLSTSCERSTASRLPFLTFIALLYTGSILYGSDVNSSHIVCLCMLLLLFLYLVWLATQKKEFQILSALLYSGMLYLDYRVVFIPLILGLGLVRLNFVEHAKDKKKDKKPYIGVLPLVALQLLGIFFVLLTPGLRESLNAGSFSLLRQYQLLDLLYPQLNSVNVLLSYYAPSFEAAFLVLIVSLYLLRNFVQSISFLLTIFLCLISLYLSLIFPFFRYMFSLVLVIRLAEFPWPGLARDNSDQASCRIEKMFLVLSEGFSRLSYTGRVFVVAAFSFVQLTSFLRLPVTDIGMPKQIVNRAIENRTCPGNRPLSEAGYLAYRFSYAKSPCRPPVLWETLSCLSDEEVVTLTQYSLNYLPVAQKQ